jgi:peptidoglycan/xylan/chitin deacetylase (PgdA/CDA1 family)
MLCFDDAWASVWTVAAPLLARYGLRAVTYPITDRVREADQPRPTLTEGAPGKGEEDRSDQPFATWPELKALLASGTIDIQSHTHRHAMIPWTPHMERIAFGRPDAPPALADPPGGWSTEGSPVFPRRSRMSDARAFLPDDQYLERCRDWIRDQGGAGGLANRSDAAEAMTQALGPPTGRFETEDEQEKALRDELVLSRRLLEDHLGHTVEQICLPWAVCGKRAEALIRDTGYRTAIADRVGGRRAAVTGGNPFRVMRLKHAAIFSLPGRGRRWFSFR